MMENLLEERKKDWEERSMIGEMIKRNKEKWINMNTLDNIRMTDSKEKESSSHGSLLISIEETFSTPNLAVKMSVS